MEEYNNVINKKYIDLVSEILNISNNSTFNNSIFYMFDIYDDYCYYKINKFDHDGNGENIKEGKVEIDKEFNIFLEILLNEFKIHCNVEIIDYIDIDNNKMYELRLITKYNDMLLVNNLDLNYAKNLLDKLKKI